MMNLIRANLGYKLLAIVMGLGVWLYVIYQEVETETTARHVEVRNVPDSYVATSCEPQEVEVELSATQQTMASLERKGVAVIADLSQAQVKGPDDYIVRLRLGEVPTGIGSYWDISPPTAKVTLEPIEHRKRSVVADRVGTPDEKYQIAATSVQPETVTVSGARSAVHEVQKVVASVDVTGLDSNQTFDVQPQALGRGDLKLSGVTIEPKTVAVEVRVRPVEFRVVPVRPNITGTLPAGYRIVTVAVEPLVVTVKGDTASRTFASLASVTTDPMDISGETTTVRRSVALRVPQGVTALSTQSCRITVRVEGEPPAVVPVPPEDEETPEPEPEAEEETP